MIVGTVAFYDAILRCLKLIDVVQEEQNKARHALRNPSVRVVGVYSTTSFGNHSESYEPVLSAYAKTRTGHSARSAQRK